MSWPSHVNLIHPAHQLGSSFERVVFWGICVKTFHVSKRKPWPEEGYMGTGLGLSYPQHPADPSTCPRNETVIGQLWGWWSKQRLLSPFPPSSGLQESVLRTSFGPRLFVLVLIFGDITWGKLPFFYSIASTEVFWCLPSYKRVLGAL